MSNSLWPHEIHHARLPCLPSPGACSNPCPLSWWCHPTSSSSVVPSPPTFNLSQHQGLFQWVRSLHQVAKGASASVLLMNIQDWFPLGWTGWISLQSKGLSRVFSNTTVQKHQSLVINQSLVVSSSSSSSFFFNGVEHGTKRGQFLALEAFEQLLVITSCSESSRICEKRLLKLLQWKSCWGC